MLRTIIILLILPACLFVVLLFQPEPKVPPVPPPVAPLSPQSARYNSVTGPPPLSAAAEAHVMQLLHTRHRRVIHRNRWPYPWPIGGWGDHGFQFDYTTFAVSCLSNGALLLELPFAGRQFHALALNATAMETLPGGWVDAHAFFVSMGWPRAPDQIGAFRAAAAALC